MPFTSVKLPKPLAPVVAVTSSKDGVSSASTSVIVRSPVAVTSASPWSPSVTAPVTVPVTIAASSAPVIVTVTVCSVPSLAVKVMLSVTVSPASRSCTAVWSSV